MESSAGAAAEKDEIRVTARKPTTTPPASKRFRNVDTKIWAASDDIDVFSTSQETESNHLHCRPLLHRAISAPSADGLMAEMGHQQKGSK
jgi:hypothetical protein